MATVRRIPADRELTFRMFLTGFFIVVLYGAVVGLLFALHLQIGFIVFIAVALAFSQYWFSDKIALWGMHGHIVTPEEEPELHGIVDRLCALADMKKPRVAIAEVDMPNAFATGRNPKNAVVCATRGIMRRLDEPELEAVLAHELSHVAHRDVAVMTIASFLGMIAGLLTRVMLFAGLFGGFGGGGGRGGNNQSGSQLAIIELGVLVVSALVYAISFLLTMALSRYRELAADRSGAILIGRPSLLASALVKVTGEMSRIPTRDLRSAEHFNAFYFTPAISNGTSLSSLFSTHPPLQKRLDALAKLEAEMNQTP
jgi:heat shock protein HtpX